MSASSGGRDSRAATRPARPALPAQLVAPDRTAVVVQECQGAVVGPDAGLAALAHEARREALPNIGRLLPAARAAGVRIVHCVVTRRADGQGANHNAKLFDIGRCGVDVTPGSPGAAILPELGPEPTDLVLTRGHGLGPMGGIDLDAVFHDSRADRRLDAAVPLGEFFDESAPQHFSGRSSRQSSRKAMRSTWVG